MEDDLTQTELDFKESPNKFLEVTLDLISALVILSGFVGNILNAIVWYSQRGRSATYIYFIAISISNTLYCTFYFLKYSLDTFGFLQEWLEDDLCEISYDHWRYFVFHPCKEIFLTATIFFSVGLSAERYVSITKPLQFNYLCTRNRTFRVTTLLLVLSVAINLPLFFEYVHDDHDDPVDRCLKPKKSALRQDPIYIWTYRVCFENLVKFMIPFALMFFFNAGIINALKRSRRFRESMSEKRSFSAAREMPGGSQGEGGRKLAEEDKRGKNLALRFNVNNCDEEDGKDEDSHFGDEKERCGFKFAQKSFDLNSEIDTQAENDNSSGKVVGAQNGFDSKLRSDGGSNVALKSFDMDSEESSASRTLKKNILQDPNSLTVKEKKVKVGGDELRSTPSPAGTPVMGIRHQNGHFSRGAPGNTHASTKSTDRNNDVNCFPCFRGLLCRCLAIRGEDQKLSFLATCYVSIFLIFILPAVTRRGLFALRSTPEFSILDTDELDYFRWISYLLDAIRPSTDFLLYMIVSTKFRASFLNIVTTPCSKAAEWTKRCRQRGWPPCGGKNRDSMEMSEDVPFRHQM